MQIENLDMLKMLQNSIFRVKDFKNKPQNIFISLDFHPEHRNDFNKLLNEGYIFLPQKKDFMEFSKFFDKDILRYWIK